MDFKLLGPLAVTEHDSSLALGGIKQRTVLAVLLLHANQVVSADRLSDELWGEAPPPSAAKSVQVHVSRLRKVIGDGRLVTRAPGYVLHVAPEELDLARFERLVADAGTVDPRAAADRLRDALTLWRGPALADLAYQPFAQAEVARLEEMRVAALEQRIDADLACGRHAELVGELEGLANEHPLRERLRCQLMLALYRSARQAEALDAYRDASRELTDGLGLEPGEELKQLEHAILTHDPALDLQPRPSEQNGTGETAVHERSLLVVPRVLEGLDPLVELAQRLAASQVPRELILAGVVAPGALADATTTLADRRAELLAEGLASRTAAFASPEPGKDVVRLASQENVELLLMDAGRSPLGGEARPVLEQAPCDVAMLVDAGGPPRSGPVMVPFGAAWHDWAALELGAWVAQATDEPLRLIGAASDGRHDGRDASRLLADASLIVQRRAGIVAEPVLARPGRKGVMALAEEAGLLIVGLSERWRQDGLGKVRSGLAAAPPCPAVLVRRGPRPGGLAPAETRSRFGWSLTGSAA